MFATVSPDKAFIVEGYGATPIDYRSKSVEEYTAMYTEGACFDIIYDMIGGATLDASFVAVKRYTGHVLSSLGWRTHALSPLSFRGATYSGVFTLYPLLSGSGRERQGAILTKAAKLVESGQLIPLLNARRFSPQQIDSAYAHVESGSLGKVVVEF